MQLYDLQADIGEQHNLESQEPEVVARLTKVLEQYVAEGRSTPGAPQQNAVPIEIHKKSPAPGAKKKGKKK